MNSKVNRLICTPTGVWFKLFLIIIITVLYAASCTSPRYLGRSAIPGRFLDDPAISGTHVGVFIYDADNRESIYSHNSDKYFIPASNTKIATLYGGLKYFDAGIPGIRYLETEDTLFLRATGDPTFLLIDFPSQPVFNLMRNTGKQIVFLEPEWNSSALGYGWPWNFYLNYYMPERSPLPVYGNVLIWAQREFAGYDESLRITSVSSYPGHQWPVKIEESDSEYFTVSRPQYKNDYTVYPGFDGDQELFVPFVTAIMDSSVELLSDTLKREISVIPAGYAGADEMGRFTTIYTCPADSLFRPMMHFSDNFFAEQVLIMLSEKLFGVMDEMLAIDYLLENELEGIPDKPRWVDGSGLSRHNLFTPRSVAWILEKIADDIGFQRAVSLLPTGGEGTLSGLYSGRKSNIYAKTGTLDGNAVALSGYIITGRERKMIFSVLVNNHFGSSAGVRKAIEEFLIEIIDRY